MTKLNQQGATEGIVAAVVALVIGLGGGYALGHTKSSSASDTSNTAHSASDKASDLRANLVSLGVQHQELTHKAVDAALDGSADADAAKAQLIQNGKDISAAVGSVYGQAAGQKFDDIWNVHLNDFVKYAIASKGGDQAGKAAALQDIDTNYTRPIAKLLSGANPNLPEATVTSAFKEHIDMTAQAIDDHVNSDYTGEQTLIVKSSDHIQMLMSILAGAIAKQYPDKF
jgi:hypothetical protein